MRAAAIWINRLLWTLIVTAVVGVGALVGLGRHYIGYVDAYQQEIVAAVRERTGLQLQVRRLGARWLRASPQFTLEHLTLFNPSNPAEAVLTVEHLVVRVGLLQSLVNRAPVFSLVEGEGVEAQLDEVRQGRWQLRGFPAGGSIDPLLDGALRIHRATLRDSRAQLHFRGGRSAQLDAHSARLQRRGNFRRLQLALQVAADGAPLKVTLEASGDPRDSEHFRARGYAEFAKVDLTPLLPLASSFGFDLKHGRIDGAAWLEWQGDDVSVRGHVALPALDLAGISGRELPPVRQIEAPFLLDSRAGRQRLWLPRVQAQWADEKIDVASLLVERDIDAPVFTVRLPRLPLDALHRALRAGNALPANVANVLDELAPAGELRNLQLQLPMAPQYRDRLRVRSEVAALKLDAWHGAPGLTGINGFIDSGLDGGSALLDGVDAQFDFPTVYRQPIPFDRIRGALDWRRDGERVLVQSGPIEAASAAGVAAVLLALDLNVDPGDPLPPQMTLLVGMRNSAAQYRGWFVPYTLPPALLDWLERSIGAAALPRGGFVYHGSLRHGDHDHRSVQLFLDVADGELKYHPDWPPLRQLQAEVWLDDAELDVHGRRARVFDQIALAAIEVALRPLPAGGEWLTATAAASARDDDILRLLRESPLRQHLGGALDRWQWRGPARAELALGIPLGDAHERPPEIRVDAELDGGTLRLADLDLTLAQVDGPLQYRSPQARGDRPGLHSPGIDARLYGRSTRIRIDGDARGAIDIRAGGRLALRDLRAWLRQPLLDHAQGEAPFDLAIRLDGERSALRASSDLVGVTVELPPPYRKDAATALPLQVALPLRGERRLQVSAGDWADLDLVWSLRRDPATGLERRVPQSGVLRLGAQGGAAHEAGRLVVTGAVPDADLKPWRALLEGWRDQLAAPAPAAPAALAVTLRDLALPAVDILGMTLRDVRVSGEHRADGAAPGWVLQVQADRLRGTGTLPDAAAQPLQLDFDQLRLPAPAAPAPGAEPPPSALAQIDPATLAAADVHIRELWRGDENWGEIGFRARPVAAGMRFDQLRGALRGIAPQPVGAAPAQLTWTRHGDAHATRFAGRLAVGDIGAVLQRWGFEPAITSHRGALDADVAWAGTPDAVGLKKLDGSAALELEDGQFLKASGSATGALKVVGVFNFANLLRRLQLDFSDLFRDGVSFDRIEGRVAMQDGVFSARTPLEITSPSSHFRLDGQIDFTTDRADLELVATLPIASNLPWVAALAGGLPAAAGVYVASKLFQAQVDHVSSAVYAIRGPWREPQVKFRRIFDDQLPKRAPPPGNAGAAAPALPAPEAQP